MEPGHRKDPAVLVSPCDAIVGACGTIQGHRVDADQGISLQFEILALLLEKLQETDMIKVVPGKSVKRLYVSFCYRKGQSLLRF